MDKLHSLWLVGKVKIINLTYTSDSLILSLPPLGHAEVASLLLDYGANKDCRTKTGITPFFQVWFISVQRTAYSQ